MREREEQRKRDEEEARKPPKPEKLIPESDTFRTGAWRVLVFLVPAVLLMLAAAFVPGEGLTFFRAIAIVIGLVLLRTALLRLLFRVRMIPKGIIISGEPGIPWTAITGCQLLAVNPLVPGRGFVIEYQLPDGGIGHAYVPRSLARYGEAWSMFLDMTTRHGSPWSFAEGIRKIKEIVADQSG